MADQDYPDLYEAMEGSIQRVGNAALAYEQTLGGGKSDSVPVNGYPPQKTIEGRLSDMVDSKSLEGIFTTTAAGLAATKGTGDTNRYFRIASSDATYETRYINNAGVAVVVGSQMSSLADNLTINKDKNFPLQQKTRGGVTSAANTTVNKFLLAVKVLGPIESIAGKYFRLAYMQNGADISGNADNGIILEEFDAATYAATGTATIIHHHTNDPASYDRAAGGIQTFTITPVSRPELSFVFTVNCSDMPASGTIINMSQSNSQAYSWIIDPSCMSPINKISASGLDSLQINKDKNFPLVPKTRGGTTSAANATVNKFLLGVKVIGPKELIDGKYFRLAYFQNGADISGNTVNGVIIEEFDAATYAATGTAVQIHNYTDAPANYDRAAGGVQTFTITPAQRQALSFVVTVNCSDMPPIGTPINMYSQPTAQGYSWIIEPACMFPINKIGGDTSSSTGVYYEWDQGTQRVGYAYRSGQYLYKVVFGVNGYNNLPNIREIYRAPYVADPSVAAWTLLSLATTDYFPPMVVAAVNDGDGGSAIYTGGNHGAAGDDSGGQTARCINFKLYADGKLISGGGNVSGWATHLNAQVVNELLAYNTISLGRYVLRQSFAVDMSGAGMELHCQVTAYEAITVSTDNGPQAYFGGFQDTMLMLGGQNTQRDPLDTSISSGSRTDYPKAWCLLTKSANGTMACWMDRDFGIGDGRYVAPTSPFIRGPGPARGKFYHAAVASATAALSSGQGYEWRGGYHFIADTVDATFDTSMAITLGRTTRMVSAYRNGSFEVM
jgi:hypothetical protein